MRPSAYSFFFAELFLALILPVWGLAAAFLALAAVLGLAFGCVLATAFAGSCLLADACTTLAASAIGAGADGPLGVPLRPLGAACFLAAPPLRPHLPKVRTGAAASRDWHSVSVRLFGSRSFGIFALRVLSVM